MNHCQKITVSFIKGPLTWHRRREGIYEISNFVNGKPSWITDSQAIWYVPKFKDWAIGYKSKIGTTRRGISSFGNQGNMDPDSVPNDQWKYFKKNHWSKPYSNDINIRCSGKSCFIDIIPSPCYPEIQCSSVVADIL